MVVLLNFEEKVHKKKLQRVDTIPLLSPTLSATTIVESISLSTNGHSWQVIQHLKQHRLDHHL